MEKEDIFLDRKLPRPVPRRSEKRVMAMEFTGWPRNKINF